MGREGKWLIEVCGYPFLGANCDVLCFVAVVVVAILCGFYMGLCGCRIPHSVRDASILFRGVFASVGLVLRNQR